MNFQTYSGLQMQLCCDQAFSLFMATRNPNKSGLEPN
jgi:hypothetical protein